MKYKIEVKKIDIKKGKTIFSNKKYINITEYCPVALALQRVFTDKTVYVYVNDCSISGESYDLPKRVVKWIGKFDGSCPVKPFSFIINI